VGLETVRERRACVSGNCERSTRVYTVDDEDIRSSGLVQVSDGLYAEVPLWCASGPIARRWIVPTCVWKLSDCKNWELSDGRSPKGVLSEEFYRNECSETVRV
jgi:hypothetical protein